MTIAMVAASDLGTLILASSHGGSERRALYDGQAEPAFADCGRCDCALHGQAVLVRTKPDGVHLVSMA